jgi:uncharacterized protein (TIGR00375 family)
MHADADLHIHSSFSIACSRQMQPDRLIAACVTRGLSVLGSGDALLPAWRNAWEPHLGNEAGIVIVPEAEVEDRDRVHHLILMEDFSGFSALAADLAPYSSDISTGGRPRVRLPGEAIAAAVHALGGLIGPAHAFTPWTSLYASFDGVADCYGDEPIDFLELGLSADTHLASAIPDLADVPFLSNSDAHSPDPARLGREWNRLDCRELSAAGVLESIRAGRIVMNAGFFPEEGKYHRTACSRCYRQYTREEAEACGWRCPDDRGPIKKGVADRASELATGTVTPRPPYLHAIPLAEVIARCLDASSPSIKRVRVRYERLIAEFGNEIAILTGVPVAAIRGIDPAVASAIDALRSGRVILLPGGGGRYGSFSFPNP